MSGTEVAAGSGSNDVRPFEVAFPDAELSDLRRRINATRLPEREAVADDAQGVPLALMEELARYWETGYDRRPCEAKLNALPQFITEIDGLDIHFIHVRYQHEDALPLIVTHGWPGSIVEQLKIIKPLTNPTAHGASAADAFHLVIPSLPGHGFSAKPTATGWDPARIAHAWVELMKRLGYTRYVAQGGELGCGRHPGNGRAGASGAPRHPLQPARHHATRNRRGVPTRRPATIRPLSRGATSIRPVERVLCEARDLRADHGDAPADLVRTRRLTRRPRFVRDRPRRRHRPARTRRTGPRRTPAGRAHARRHPRQHHVVLANEHRGLGGSPLLGEPCGLLRGQADLDPIRHQRLPDELYQAPRSWAERAYPDNHIHYNQLDRGGHFAAWEQPRLFSKEVRAAFRSLR